MNWWLFPVTALIPLLVGSVYYNERVVGGLWMRATGLEPERLRGGNMAVIFGLTYLFILLIVLILQFMVVHQLSVGGLLVNQDGFGEAGSPLLDQLARMDQEFGLLSNHRSFGHGVFHGLEIAIAFVGPIFAINALFERRRWNYVLIHVGYWALTLALMGGVLCAFLRLPLEG